MVMPNRVTKPTSDPTERMLPVSTTAATPPTSANGRFASTRSMLRRFWNTMESSMRIPRPATRDYVRISCCAASRACEAPPTVM